MATTSKNLYRGVLAVVGVSPLYTVPSATTTVITNVIVCNKTSSARTFSISITNAGLSGGTVLFSDTPIPAKTTTVIDLKQVLSATQELYASADSTVSVDISINGVEIN